MTRGVFRELSPEGRQEAPRKGGQKGGRPRCHKCGEEGHIQRWCKKGVADAGAVGADTPDDLEEEGGEESEIGGVSRGRDTRDALVASNAWIEAIQEQEAEPVGWEPAVPKDGGTQQSLSLSSSETSAGWVSSEIIN